MPELPVVEFARTLVEKHCLAERIISVCTKEVGGGPRNGLFDDVVYENGKDKSTENIIHSHFVNKKLIAVKRKGKYVWFQFESEVEEILFHFGMTGAFLIKDVEPAMYRTFKVDQTQWPPKFCKLLLSFSNGIHLAFVDSRRFGRIKIRATPTLVPPLSTLGSDPVNDPLPSASELHAKLSSCSSSIKSVLLDQERVFCGLGNWLVDEILYQTAVHPATAANALSCATLDAMLQNMTHILAVAVANNISYERFPAHWLFHRRWDKGKSAATMPDGTCCTVTFIILRHWLRRHQDCVRDTRGPHLRHRAERAEEVRRPEGRRGGRRFREEEKKEEHDHCLRVDRRTSGRCYDVGVQCSIGHC